MNYNSKSDIVRVLSEKGLSPQKRFGQNFLLSQQVREQIISVTDIKPGSCVWEIGPGLGSMTELALQAAGPGKLTVFEIDRGYSALLGELYGERIEIVEGDFLKKWKSIRDRAGMPDRVFGNLPYNCASAIIASIIEDSSEPEKMVFTVQKEVAHRMAATAGECDYSSFSVICGIACDVKIEGDIRGGAFFPVPDVTSTIVSMKPHKRFSFIEDRKAFSMFLRMLFNSRRKTVINNLKSLGRERVELMLKETGIDPGIRAEKIEKEKIADLFRKIYLS